jgi:endonuclease YncB( thermonuclease family)
MKHRPVLVIVALAAATVVIPPLADAGSFTSKGTVSRVVDGDTLDVRLNGGKTERVRLIGRA